MPTCPNCNKTTTTLNDVIEKIINDSSVDTNALNEDLLCTLDGEVTMYDVPTLRNLFNEEGPDPVTHWEVEAITDLSETSDEHRSAVSIEATIWVERASTAGLQVACTLVIGHHVLHEALLDNFAL